MADINGRREPARSAVNVSRALELKALGRGWTWRKVGRVLAEETGRRAAFTAQGVIHAIQAAGRWDERPR